MPLIIFAKLEKSEIVLDFIDTCYTLSPAVEQINANEFFIDMGNTGFREAASKLKKLELLSYKQLFFGLAYNKLDAKLAALILPQYPMLTRKLTPWGCISWITDKTTTPFYQQVSIQDLGCFLQPKTLDTLDRVGISNLQEAVNISLADLEALLGPEAKMLYFLSRGIIPYIPVFPQGSLRVSKQFPPHNNLEELSEYIKEICKELEGALKIKNNGCLSLHLQATLITGSALSMKKRFVNPKRNMEFFHSFCLDFFQKTFKGQYIPLSELCLFVKEYSKTAAKQLNLEDMTPLQGQSLEKIKGSKLVSPCPTVSRREQILSSFDICRQKRC
ncbi:MAG: hypothetical protein AB1420_05340 [Bacillota bacterium]